MPIAIGISNSNGLLFRLKDHRISAQQKALNVKLSKNYSHLFIIITAMVYTKKYF